MELKPCPFCGGKAIMVAYDPYNGYQGTCITFRAACKCGAMIEKRTEKEAVESWNRRAGE